MKLDKYLKTAHKFVAGKVGDGGELEPIVVKAAGQGGWYAGMSAADAKAQYRKIHALGVLLKSHYRIRLTPYSSDSVLHDIPLFAGVDDNVSALVNLGKSALQKIGSNFVAESDVGKVLTHAMSAVGGQAASNNTLAWRAMDCTLPIINAEVDSVKVGHYQYQYLTGNQRPEINITFLETAQGDILNSAIEMSELMFPSNGTLIEPSKYAFWLEVILFPKENRGFERVFQKYLCQLQTANAELAARETTALEVPLTFTQLPPYLDAY